jgi:hypothetical protein
VQQKVTFDLPMHYLAQNDRTILLQKTRCEVQCSAR